MVHQLKATRSLLTHIRNAPGKLSFLRNRSCQEKRRMKKEMTQKSSHRLYTSIHGLYSSMAQHFLFALFPCYFVSFSGTRPRETFEICFGCHCYAGFSHDNDGRVQFLLYRKTRACTLWMIRQERTRLNHS